MTKKNEYKRGVVHATAHASSIAEGMSLAQTDEVKKKAMQEVADALNAKSCDYAKMFDGRI